MTLRQTLAIHGRYREWNSVHSGGSRGRTPVSTRVSSSPPPPPTASQTLHSNLCSHLRRVLRF
jgi:hypothetical protein